MKFKDLILTASSNLLRSKMRTLLTIIAIFVGAFTLTLTSALGAGVTSYVDAQLGNLGQESTIIIQPKSDQTGSPSDPIKYDPDAKLTLDASGNQAKVITAKELNLLKEQKFLSSVEPFVLAAPDYIEGKNKEKYRMALSPVMEDVTFDLLAGEPMTKGATAKELILPKNFVEALGYDSPDAIVGETVTIGISTPTGKLKTVNATVKGVLTPGIIAQAGAVANNALRNELHAIQTQGLPPQATEVYFAAFAQLSGDYSAKAMDKAKAELEELGFNATTVDDQLGVFNTVIKVITYMLNGFALIALLAAGFGIVNTLLMSVQERTKEIGLMKSMGMSPRRIFALFSVEAILIGFWGSVMGIIGAVAVGFSINNWLADGFLKDLPGLSLFSYPPSIIAFTMVLIMTIAFVAGALPARRASKLDPIDALRYE